MNKILIKYPFYFFVIFSFLITPVININLPFKLNNLDILFSIIILLLAITDKRKYLLNKFNILFIFIIFAILVLDFILFDIYTSFGIELISRTIFTIIVSRIFYFRFHDEFGENSNSIFLNILLIIVILQTVALLVSPFSNSLSNIIGSIFMKDLSDENIHLTINRSSAFSPTGGDGLSLNHCLLCLTLLLNYSNFKKSFQKYVLFVSVIGAISTVYTGRTGLIIYVFVLLIWFLFFFKSKYKILKITFSTILTVLIVSQFISQVDNLAIYFYNQYGMDYSLTRLFYGISIVLNNSSIEDSTLYTIFNSMIIFPDSIFEFLFGNGGFGRFGKIIESDVGYIRLLHGFGIIGIVLILSIIFPVKILLRKFGSSNFKRNHLNISLLFIILFGLIANFKLIYFTSRIFIFVVQILICQIYINTKSMKCTLI